MKVTRLANQGPDHDQDRANKAGIAVGSQWEVTGGEVHDFISYYTLEGVEGKFNTTMFSGDWQDHQHLMKFTG